MELVRVTGECEKHLQLYMLYNMWGGHIYLHVWVSAWVCPPSLGAGGRDMGWLSILSHNGSD